MSGRPSQPRSPRSDATPPCWSTPTTSPPGCGRPSRSPDPSSSSSARDTKIVVTSDLDEYAIAALAAAPVDSYGVGTSVVTGSGAPTAGFVYKLVARATAPHPDAPMRPVAKASAGKIGRGGRKWALRRYDAAGRAVEEVLHSAPPRPG